MMHCNERKERGKERRQKTKAQIPERIPQKGVFFLLYFFVFFFFFKFLPPARITGRFRYHAEKKHAIQIKRKKKEIIQNLTSNELTQTKETT